ncbi:unnamed protein product, partial [Mesorhabditis belari]|uniref:Uncharacterized protein n=1 Tax=Mesorhabditis belari TaxID=2138241 RepID=A0AAF3EE68_9BILA
MLYIFLILIFFLRIPGNFGNHWGGPIGTNTGDERFCPIIAGNIKNLLQGGGDLSHSHILKRIIGRVCQENACAEMYRHWENNIECLINVLFGTMSVDEACRGAGTHALPILQEAWKQPIPNELRERQNEARLQHIAILERELNISSAHSQAGNRSVAPGVK